VTEDRAAEVPGGEVRASDAEREAVVERLREASAEGRLTLEELTDRTGAAYTATTRGDLAPLTRDLPAPDERRAGGPGLAAADARPLPARPDARQGRVLAVLGDVERTGRWWPEDQLAATAVLGDVKLDLRDAYVPAEGVTITATAVLGDVTILVPAGVRVELTGTAVLGDKKLDVTPVPFDAPGPTVRVRGYAILGDIRVSHSPRRSLRDRLFGPGTGSGSGPGAIPG
jgi:hypothetical protein